MSKLDFIICLTIVALGVALAIYTGAFDAFPWSRLPSLTNG